MSLQWMDDFSFYGTGSTGVARMLNGLYAENGCSLVVDPDPTGTGATVLRMINPSNGESLVRRVLSGGQTTVGVAARYWLSTLPATTSSRPRFVSFRNASNQVLCYLTLDPSGYLEAYNGSGTLVARSDSPVVIANSWRHMETKCTFSTTVGAIAVRIEGVSVLNVTGINTMGATTGTCENVCLAYLGTNQNSPYMHVKDFIIWDSSGTSNNDWIGTCKVYKIIPDGDVSLNWTPSTGTTGWNLINEATPDDDTSYISAAWPAPSPAQFTMTNLPDDVSVVKGVMAIHRSKKTDGGDGSAQITLVEGINSANGADKAITTAYTYWTDIFNVAPDGGNWNKAKVDNLNLKINRTA